MVTLSIVLGLLGVSGYIPPGGGVDYGALLVFCFVWGMGGAFISLLMSRWIAKRAMGVQAGRRPDRTAGARLAVPHGRAARPAGATADARGRRLRLARSQRLRDRPEQARASSPCRRGCCATMRPEEVEGVLAHEVAHIQNGDMVTMTLIQGVVNAFVMFLARIIASIVRQAGDERYAYILSFVVTIVLDIVLGFLGMMVVAWFSRAREFRADAGGAALAGRGNMICGAAPAADATATGRQQRAGAGDAQDQRRRAMMALMSTHPPLETRIRALESALNSREWP